MDCCTWLCGSTLKSLRCLHASHFSGFRSGVHFWLLFGLPVDTDIERVMLINRGTIHGSIPAVDTCARHEVILWVSIVESERQFGSG